MKWKNEGTVPDINLAELYGVSLDDLVTHYLLSIQNIITYHFTIEQLKFDHWWNKFMRVTKNPEVRRKELMDTAEELFLEKGYENVEVSRIVKKVGVAQGTFYYYFKSKEAVLDAIIDKYISILIEDMEDIANQKDITSLEKLMKMFPFSLSFPGGHEGIMHHLQEEKNTQLRIKLEQRFPQETIGLFTGIIKQGIEEGVFNTKYPEEAAKAYVGTTAFILQGIDNLDPNSPEFKRKFRAISYFTERILGAEEGSIIKIFMGKAPRKS